jgi:hypothetical protein
MYIRDNWYVLYVLVDFRRAIICRVKQSKSTLPHPSWAEQEDKTFLTNVSNCLPRVISQHSRKLKSPGTTLRDLRVAGQS